MKLVFAVAIAGLAMTLPASAGLITLDFTSAGVPPGDNGGVSYISDGYNGHSATGGSLAVSQLTVSGSPSLDGTYAITGLVNADQYGSLSFNTDLNTINLSGAIAALGIASPETLLAGTGLPFTNVSVTTPGCAGYPDFYQCPTISFDAYDTVSASLQAALGISSNHFVVNSVAIALGTGNQYPEYSVTLSDENIPEPSTLSLLSVGFIGLGGLFAFRRRRQSRHSAGYFPDGNAL